MDVTKSNFSEVLPLLEDALSACQFFAVDLEFSGLYDPIDPSPEYLDDIEDRYQQMQASAQKFMPLQVGLSAFCWEGQCYKTRTFNFNVFPAASSGNDRRFLCQAGSLQFLSSNGFDFNKLVAEGIPYLLLEVRDRRIAALDEPWQRWGDDIIVSKPEDVRFVADLVQQVTDWLKGDDVEVVLAGVNGYQRALQYQHLEKDIFGAEEFPGFSVSVRRHSEAIVIVHRVETGRWPQLKLTRASAAEIAEHKAADRQIRLQAIEEAAGFARVIEMLRDSGKPAVGHNMALDLAFLFYAFIAPLPDSWDAYKALLQVWLPGGIYDTKHLARQLPEIFSNETSLGEVFNLLRETPANRQLPNLLAAALPLPGVEHSEGFGRYDGENADQHAHEAGYDAFMTGSVFAALVAIFRHKASSSDKPGPPASRDKAEHEAQAAPGAGAPKAALEPSGSRLAHGQGKNTGDAGASGRNGRNGRSGDTQGAYQPAASALAPIVEKLVQASQMPKGVKDAMAEAGRMGALRSPRMQEEQAGPSSRSTETRGAPVASHDDLLAAENPALAVRASQPSLESVEEFKGRVNLMRTDMPYAAILGSDSPLQRGHVLVLEPLPSGADRSSLGKQLAPWGLPRNRISLRDSGRTAFVEFSNGDDAAQLVERVRGIPEMSAEVMTYAEYAKGRHAQRAALNSRKRGRMEASAPEEERGRNRGDIALHKRQRVSRLSKFCRTIKGYFRL